MTHVRLLLLALLAGLSADVYLAVLDSLHVSAQGGPGLRQLTRDGHSTPLAWDASGILVARPGPLTSENGPSRVTNEWWRIDPVDGSERLVARDAPARLPGSPGNKQIYVTNGEALQPQLWLAGALLLSGESEYFLTPSLSPGAQRFVFTRTPTGNETDAFSTIWLGEVGGELKPFIAGATSPVWSADGTRLAFEHAGDVYIGNWNVPGGWPEPTNRPAPPAHVESLTPPAVIRVIHTQGNYNFSQSATCRPPGLSVGTIMTFPFEAYLSYVVPIEVSPSGPPEQLKAQALAARTYAWGRINPGSPYDVSDWTDTQAMCDLRADPRSTAAVTTTAGQYIAFGGNLISALYSAENGDPTRNCPYGGGCQYLKAVDDPVSFRRTRNGHGGGMSQNGAYRWALWYGWDYVQILTHYYSGVTIEGPGDFGGFVLPWSRWYLTSNRVRIAGEASNGSTLNIFARAQALSPRQVATNTLLTALDLAALPDQPLGALVLTSTVGSTFASTLTLGIDRVPPTGTLSAPAYTFLPTVTLQLSGSDGGPSGFAGYGLSNRWLWEGEDRVARGYVSGAGNVVTDGAAFNGKTLFAAAGNSTMWFGPYTFDLPLGQAYRAYFRLKTGNNLTTSQLAKLDVVGDGLTPIGIKRVYATDFRAANQYQEFAVEFNYVQSPTMGLEFRVDSEGPLPADLYLDRVLVATYPLTTPLIVHWPLPAGWPPAQTVIAKFSDNAGNVSADVSQTIVFSAPVQLFLPWIGH